jgi:indolepyruvate ferredoxin oxidoreductase
VSDYQNRAYAERYKAFVARVAAAEEKAAPGRQDLAQTAARGYFKLLAIKDEYEVARLHSAPEFRDKLRRQFAGDYKLSLHLAPPLLSPRDAHSGHPIKREYGAWIFPVLRMLAGLRGLRGGVLDPFGWTAERRQERALIAQYETLMDELLAKLTADNHEAAVALAALPEEIRGYGHVKAENIEKAKVREAELLTRFRDPNARPLAAE